MGSRPDYHNTTNIGASVRINNDLFNLPQDQFEAAMLWQADEIKWQWMKEAMNERERKIRTRSGLRVLPKNNIGLLGEDG